MAVFDAIDPSSIGAIQNQAKDILDKIEAYDPQLRRRVAINASRGNTAGWGTLATNMSPATTLLSAGS